MEINQLNTEQPVKNLVLPAEHIRIRLIRANETYLLASRGSFKTSRALPLYVIDMVHEMPRSTGVIVGLSYEHMGDNTINPFLHALEEMGFHSGEHYVYGKRPPDHWPKPYLGIVNEKYDHIMTWYNGTVLQVVSLKKRASANGVSAQWGFFDEVKFMNEKQLTEEIFPIFRGNEEYFLHSSGYLSKFFATDKEADPVQLKWLLKKRKLQDPLTNDIIITLQLEVNEKKFEYFNNPDIGKLKLQKLKKEIDELEQELSGLRANLVYVAEISADDVRPLLGDRWYNDKRRNSSDRVWKVAYKNEDPIGAGDSFYPCYNENLHEYDRLDDINPHKPFIIAPDYQHSVAPIPISQLTKLPWMDVTTLNYVDEVYTLANPKDDEIKPNGNGKKGWLAEAVQLFCDRYINHKKKKVYFVYDHTAKGRRVGVDEYYKIVARVLKQNKWQCVKVYTGKAPLHYLKYSNTNDWLQHSDPTLPAILINRVRCPKMITSIKGAPAKTSAGKTEKDKSLEDTVRYPDVDQSETTHFSDSFDMINHAVLCQKKIKVKSSSSSVGMRG